MTFAVVCVHPKWQLEKLNYLPAKAINDKGVFVMIDLDQSNFQKEVLDSKVPVLVDFWAPWCGPCKMVGPVIEEIASQYSGKIEVGKINVDDNQQLASEYGVMSIPTICLFKDGNPAFKLVGFRPKKEIAGEIDKYLG